MAIFTRGAGFTTPKVIAGMNFTAGAQGQPVINTANDNRSVTDLVNALTHIVEKIRRGRGHRGTSPQGPDGFGVLDQLIVSLDALYGLLPNQADWITYAANIAGNWQLCANCQPDASGKKLFRQYNYNRAILGLPIVTVPIDATAFAEVTFITAEYVVPPISPLPAVDLNWSGSGDFIVLLAQQGAVMANPRLTLDPAFNGVGTIAAPPFAWVESCVKFLIGLPPPPGSYPIFQQCCIFNLDGAPGRKLFLEIDIQA
jgi:hypothetical protein